LEKKRNLIPRMENKRVWRPRMKDKSVLRKGWRTREFGDQGADNERVETWRAEQECRVPHLGSGAVHRRAISITGTSGTAAVGRLSIGSCT